MSCSGVEATDTPKVIRDVKLAVRAESKPKGLVRFPPPNSRKIDPVDGSKATMRDGSPFADIKGPVRPEGHSVGTADARSSDDVLKCSSSPIIRSILFW